jgi:hypothetical protein
MKRFVQIIFVMLFGATAAVFLVYWTGTPGLPFSTTAFQSAILNFASRSFPEVETPFGLVKLQTKESTRGLDVEIFCARCTLSDPSISREPLVLSNVQLKGVYRSPMFEGVMEVGKVKSRIEVEWLGLSARGEFELAETKISEIYRVLREVVPEVDAAQIRGFVSGKGTFRWPEFYLSFSPQVKGFSVDGLIDPDWYRGGGFSYLVRRGDGSSGTRRSGEGSADWLSFGKMGHYLPDAIIASEDGSFYSHPGYDLSSIAEATKDNAKDGKLSRGGSTITQQLAKNLFLSPERTFSRKLRELLYAVEMDRELKKRRILELYLNIVEWGPDIFGVKQAAKVYFARSPERLRPEQAAWLASILRNPTTSYRMQYLRNRPELWRTRLVLDRMKRLSGQERELAKSSAIVFQHEEESLQ